MTSFPLTEEFDVLEAKEKLTTKFPNHKVRQAFFNKNVLRVSDTWAIVIIRSKRGQLKVAGSLNMKGWLLVVFILLLFFLLFAGLLLYGILWYVKKDQIKALEHETASFLKHQYETIP